MNWKIMICLVNLWWFNGVLGNLFDTINEKASDLINNLNPIISVQMKELLKMTPEEWIKSQGFEAETHFVTTSDGYILQLVRILSNRPSEKVILGMHGVECDCFHFIWNQRNQSLAFLLADANYEVWLGSPRGSRYSKNHTKLDPQNIIGEFWDFSIDEIALIDLPAIVEYIKNKTGVEKIDYIGQSEGTTELLMTLSWMPGFANSFRSVHFLAPVMSLQSSTSLLMLFADLLLPILEKLRSTGIGQLPEFIVAFLIAFCGISSATSSVCYFALDLILGKTSYNQSNSTQLPLYMEHVIRGASTGQFAHYAQMRAHDNFCKYDFGEDINMKKYGQKETPCYNISNIQIPLNLYTSDNDAIAQPADVQVLAQKLNATGHLGSHYNVPSSVDFNHVNFVDTIHGDHFVYNHLLDELNKP